MTPNNQECTQCELVDCNCGSKYRDYTPAEMAYYIKQKLGYVLTNDIDEVLDELDSLLEYGI